MSLPQLRPIEPTDAQSTPQGQEAACRTPARHRLTRLQGTPPAGLVAPQLAPIPIRSPWRRVAHFAGSLVAVVGFVWFVAAILGWPA